MYAVSLRPFGHGVPVPEAVSQSTARTPLKG